MSTEESQDLLGPSSSVSSKDPKQRVACYTSQFSNCCGKRERNENGKPRGVGTRSHKKGKMQQKEHDVIELACACLCLCVFFMIFFFFMGIIYSQ